MFTEARSLWDLEVSFLKVGHMSQQHFVALTDGDRYSSGFILTGLHHFGILTVSSIRLDWTWFKWKRGESTAGAQKYNNQVMQHKFDITDFFDTCWFGGTPCISNLYNFSYYCSRGCEVNDWHPSYCYQYVPQCTQWWIHLLDGTVLHPTAHQHQLLVWQLSAWELIVLCNTEVDRCSRCYF